MSLAPPGTGSNPPHYSYKPPNDPNAFPVPFWFQPLSAQRFRSMQLKDSDIIVSSGVKMGTTWVTKILVSLLYEYDDEGKLRDGSMENRNTIPNRSGQTYPDALYANRDDKDADNEGIFARVPDGRVKVDGIFGDFTFDDLVNQPEPRLFSTHLFGRRLLPRQLFNEAPVQRNGNTITETESKGRLIIVLRNLKDTMCSLHHFRGLPMDGWDGNEHGPGTYRRYIAEKCPNAFGSAFEWLKETQDALNCVKNGRAHVIYYESLILDFDAQLKELNDFLGLDKLTVAKCEAIREACAAKTMSKDNERYKATVEKGKVGEWEKYLDEERCAEFDSIFDERLRGIDIAEPMRFFQRSGFISKLKDITIIDELRKEWSLVNNNKS